MLQNHHCKCISFKFPSLRLKRKYHLATTRCQSAAWICSLTTKLYWRQNRFEKKNSLDFDYTVPNVENNKTSEMDQFTIRWASCKMVQHFHGSIWQPKMLRGRNGWYFKSSFGWEINFPIESQDFIPNYKCFTEKLDMKLFGQFSIQHILHYFYSEVFNSFSIEIDYIQYVKKSVTF